MFDSPVLDAAIGLAFLFLIYSLLATSVNEAIATLFGLRSRMLRKAIIDGMLSKNDWMPFLKSIRHGISNLTKDIIGVFKRNHRDNKHIGWKFYNDPTIRNYGENSVYPYPSYIASKDFAETLRRILTNKSTELYAHVPNFDSLSDMQKIKLLLDDETLKATPFIDDATLTILRDHIKEANYNLESFEKRLENWFDNHMNRVSGWYKRQTQYFLFFIGLSMAIILKIDAIRITRHLLKDDVARAQMVEMAIAASQNPNYSRSTPSAIDTNRALEESSRIFDEGYSRVKADMDGAKTLMALGWKHFGDKDIDYITSIKDDCFVFYPIKQKMLLDFDDIKQFYFSKDTTELSQQIELAKLDSIDVLLGQLEIAKDSIEEQNKLLKAPQLAPKDSLRALLRLNRFTKDTAIINGMIRAIDIKTSKVINQKLDELTMAKIIDSHPCFYKTKYVWWSIWNKSFMLLGFLITAFAICLGAPFWFDLLNKLTRLRAAGKKEDGSDSGSTTTNTITVNTSSSQTENIPG